MAMQLNPDDMSDSNSIHSFNTPTHNLSTLQRIQIQLNQLSENNLHLNQQLLEARGEIAAQSAIIQRSRSLSVNSSNRIKINKPKEFTGNRDETSQFLAQCSLVFEADPTTFADYHQRIIYTTSFLRGDAFKWYEAALYRQERSFDSYSEFTTLLRSVFGEDTSTSQDKSYENLAKLRHTHSCQQFSTRFVQLASRVNIDQDDLAHLYKSALKPEIRLHLIGLRPQPSTLQELMNASIEYDDALYNLNQKNRSTSHQSNVSFRRNNQPNFPQSRRTEPMDLDSLNLKTESPKFPKISRSTSSNISKRGPLSDAEKKHRRDNHLCLYDGKSDCPGKDDLTKCPLLAARPDFRASRTPHH